MSGRLKWAYPSSGPSKPLPAECPFTVGLVTEIELGRPLWSEEAENRWKKLNFRNLSSCGEGRGSICETAVFIRNCIAEGKLLIAGKKEKGPAS